MYQNNTSHCHLNWTHCFSICRLLAHGNEFESESPAQSDVTLNLKPELASDQTPDGSTSVTSSNETPSTDSNNSTAAAKSLKCDELVQDCISHQ